ncbi:hypothetical protein TNCV_1952181 [Trichonephila clavipes]|nr:hypothetical protein TNCV_1952181 [Trichonephila clavipes]
MGTNHRYTRDGAQYFRNSDEIWVFAHDHSKGIPRVSGFDKTSNLRQRGGRKNILTERDHRRLKGIVTRGRRSTLHIAVDFNVSRTASVGVRTVQRTLIDAYFLRHRLPRVPLLTQQHKDLSLAWARQYHIWTLNEEKLSLIKQVTFPILSG